MEIRECNNCDFVGWIDDCVHPKHTASLSLCPECNDTTFIVTPSYVSGLKYESENNDKLRRLERRAKTRMYISVLRQMENGEW